MNLPTETPSDRRTQRELATARAAGTAPPEVDVKTGAMINPHNPEFITKRPWYLADSGGVSGPSLDHQADQRRDEDKRELSLSEANRLVKEEREKVKKKLEWQKLKEKSLRKMSRKSILEDNDVNGINVYELGMWIEALRKNKRPYLIAQIVKISEKGKCFDLKYEDGYIERSVRPWGRDKKKSSSSMVMGLPRMRITRTGNRSHRVHKCISGKETYDSKRDAYHGVEIEGHMKKMEEKFREREAMRKEQRQKERERKEKEQLDLIEKEKEQQETRDQPSVNDLLSQTFEANPLPSDSDSDYDSDNERGNKNFSGGGYGSSSSEDEFVQNDNDAKLFSSRLARQGGVGGAQMKITARNLRIREDTAKYLRNLDPNSAYYDPKSRSMRDNPYLNTEEGNNPQQQQQAAESLGFAGDNFTRISGDAIKLAETQLFAWDAEKKFGVEGVVHVQADPSRTELMRKQVERRGEEMKRKKRRMVLSKYGGEEYLEGNAVASGNHGEGVGMKETPEERVTRFGVAHTEQEYNRDGLPTLKNCLSSRAKKHYPIPCKYEEDVHANGHTAVWGSYFHKGAFRWGYADDHSLIRSSYGTGMNGRIANDESNELKYGTGVAGSAMLAAARKMLDVIPRSALNSVSSNENKYKPNQQSKLYGEMSDQQKVFDKDRVDAALKRLQQADNAALTESNNKRKYNSLHANIEVTEEDIEAYRILKGRGTEDPMMRSGATNELLEYK